MVTTLNSHHPSSEASGVIPCQNSLANLTILGAGAWGSALAALASINGHQVRIWSRRGDLSLEDAIRGADVVRLGDFHERGGGASGAVAEL